MTTMDFFVFEVAGNRFALPLSFVEEVVPSSIITQIPDSPPFLLGLAAVRGKVMAVIDAARRYGIGPGLSSFFMVCRVRGNLTAVAIDRAVVAGCIPVVPMELNRVLELKKKSKVEEKFLKQGFELFEFQEENKSTISTGTYFLEIDPDLFVSTEMASKVGEI